ncbi:hypothetical protein KC19_4G094200 [Ceratodon purpureus]|uniref:Subtilisin-like protease n=1 Tax=Ceratodon purpureus TaxID=3225 RepID=A0A8T0IA69_CERPU|nr:hypothetical protein KC19_4G094200 [Ceratodon purpureus]
MVRLRGTFTLLPPLLVSVCLLLWTETTLGSAHKSTYIVHMERNSSHTDISIKAAWYRDLLRIATLEADQLLEPDEDDLHHVYHHTFDGFSALLTPQQVAYLQSSPQVIQLQRDTLHKEIHTTHSPEFMGLADGHLWPESNYGEDVIIGVVDTGVWPERPSFGDQQLGPIPSRWKGICESGTNFSASEHCNRKLIGARSFYKGYEAEYGVIDEAGGEYKSPRDSEGHGTHTASTAAGTWSHMASVGPGLGLGTARGMAPKARLAIYKAFWNARNSDADTLAAVDQAVADGVDVLSLSLGSPYDQARPDIGRPQLWKDMLAIAAYGAMKKGVFLSLTAGNEGLKDRPNQTTGTVNNVAPWMTTVGASTTDRIFPADVVLGNGTVIQGKSGLNSKLLENMTSLISGCDAAKNSSVNYLKACLCYPDTLSPALVRGKIVMCTIQVDKGAAVLEAGGVGIIDASWFTQGDGIEIQSDYVLPTVRVGATARRIITEYINSTNSPTAQLRDPRQTQYNRAPAPAVATFSSRGPSYAYSWNVIKPDIIAPGVNIIAAGIKEKQYAMNSGTSMACPHVSGLAALLKAAHPTWSPAAIRSALMTTATTKDSNNATITLLESGQSGTPFDFGSGFVRPERATDPGLVYDLSTGDYLNYLCMLRYPPQIIRAFDADAPACPATPIRVEDFNYPSFLVTIPVSEASTHADRTLTNVGSARATYVASVTDVANITIDVHPPILSFNGLNEKKSFTLTVSVTNSLEDGIHYSSLTWSDGVHTVQSPIVIRRGSE